MKDMKYPDLMANNKGCMTQSYTIDDLAEDLKNSMHPEVGRLARALCEAHNRYSMLQELYAARGEQLIAAGIEPLNKIIK